jgi:hypothetical protein
LEIKKNMWGPRLSSVNENMFYWTTNIL